MNVFQAGMIVLFMMAIPALIHYRHWKITQIKEGMLRKKEELAQERQNLIERLEGSAHLFGFQEGRVFDKEALRFRFKHLSALIGIGFSFSEFKDLNHIEQVWKEMEKYFARIESIDGMKMGPHTSE
ncbi:MAG: hypothetical protein GC192_21415 [Bacteroidetes bacterium]|nr:hypothetical protein [Bacteroidota bacterium]